MPMENISASKGARDFTLQQGAAEGSVAALRWPSSRRSCKAKAPARRCGDVWNWHYPNLLL